MRHSALSRCAGAKCSPHPSLVPLLPPFLNWGSAQPPPLISARFPKAEQTLPWGPSRLCKPHQGPWGSSPPALLSYHPPYITFSSFTISLLLQALPGPIPSSQDGFCSDTPRDWSGEGNAILPCVLQTSPSQHLPLFWEQRSHWGFTDSWGWLFKFMPLIFWVGGFFTPINLSIV